MDWTKLKRARGVHCSSSQVGRMAPMLKELKDVPKGIVLPREVNYRTYSQRRAAFQAQGKPMPLPPDIYQMDFRELLPKGIVQARSVNCIITDPPWRRDCLPLWSTLANFADEALIPGGFLIAYCGSTDVDAQFASLASRLEFVSLSILDLSGSGAHYSEGNTRVVVGFRPVVIFAKDKVPDRDIMHHNRIACEQDKRFHPWQQGLKGAIRLLTDFTVPADLVVDPFGGAFTFAEACKLLGRRCISCDIDPAAVAIAKLRLNDNTKENAL